MQDRWVHDSLQVLHYVTDEQTDLAYAGTVVEWGWTKVF